MSRESLCRSVVGDSSEGRRERLRVTFIQTGGEGRAEERGRRSMGQKRADAFLIHSAASEGE